MATPMTPEERALVSGYLSGQLPPQEPVNLYTGQSFSEPNQSVAPAQAPAASLPISSEQPPPAAQAPAVNAYTGQPLPPPGPPPGLRNAYTGQPLAPPATAPAPAPVRVGGMGAGGPSVGPPAWLRKAQGLDTGATGEVDPATGVQLTQPSLDAGLNPHRVGLVVKPELPDETAALDQSLSEGFAAQRQQGEAEITRAEQTADRAVTAADEQAGVDAAMAQRELDRQAQLQKMDAHFQELSDELANQDIRAPSVFGETVGDQILNRIALFIGTIGSGVSGQPNLVWDKLNKDVERSIAADKETRQLKREQLGDQAKMVDMVRARFQDERVVDATLREAKYRKIAAELGRFAEYAKTPERKAALESLMAQADVAITQAAIERRKAGDTAWLQERAIRARAAARPDPLAQMVKRSGQLATLAENDRKIRGTDQVDQKAIRQAQADYQASLRRIDEYERRNATLGLTSDLKDRKSASAARDQLVTAYQNEYLGKSDSDRKAAEETFPEGGATTTETSVRAAAAAARNAAKIKLDQAVQGATGQAQNFQPTTEQR